MRSKGMWLAGGFVILAAVVAACDAKICTGLTCEWVDGTVYPGAGAGGFGGSAGADAVGGSFGAGGAWDAGAGGAGGSSNPCTEEPCTPNEDKWFQFCAAVPAPAIDGYGYNHSAGCAELAKSLGLSFQLVPWQCLPGDDTVESHPKCVPSANGAWSWYCCPDSL